MCRSDPLVLCGVLAKPSVGLITKASTAARTIAPFVSSENQLLIIVLIPFQRQYQTTGEDLLIERIHEINKVKLLEAETAVGN